MANDDVALAGLEPASDDSPPPIPEAGLAVIFPDWSGAGELWDALAAVNDSGYSRRRRHDVVARAHRSSCSVLSRRFGNGRAIQRRG